MKIYRSHYLKHVLPEDCEALPILKSTQDSFIRKGYYGGATDYYKKYGENLHYYDVNSLYPFAQSGPMPFECLGYRDSIPSLDTFFGFVEAIVIVPDTVVKPMLPYKVGGGRTIFPTGR